MNKQNKTKNLQKQHHQVAHKQREAELQMPFRRIPSSFHAPQRARGRE